MSFLFSKSLHLHQALMWGSCLGLLLMNVIEVPAVFRKASREKVIAGVVQYIPFVALNVAWSLVPSEIW